MTLTLKTAMAGVDIDIGKNSFHVVGLDQRDAIVLLQKVIATPSGRAICYMPPCLMGIEAALARIISNQAPV